MGQKLKFEGNNFPWKVHRCKKWPVGKNNNIKNKSQALYLKDSKCKVNKDDKCQVTAPALAFCFFSLCIETQTADESASCFLSAQLSVLHVKTNLTVRQKHDQNQ